MTDRLTAFCEGPAADWPAPLTTLDDSPETKRPHFLDISLLISHWMRNIYVHIQVPPISISISGHVQQQPDSGRASAKFLFRYKVVTSVDAVEPFYFSGKLVSKYTCRNIHWHILHTSEVELWPYSSLTCTNKNAMNAEDESSMTNCLLSLTFVKLLPTWLFPLLIDNSWFSSFVLLQIVCIKRTEYHYSKKYRRYDLWVSRLCGHIHTFAKACLNSGGVWLASSCL